MLAGRAAAAVSRAGARGRDPSGRGTRHHRNLGGRGPGPATARRSGGGRSVAAIFIALGTEPAGVDPVRPCHGRMRSSRCPRSRCRHGGRHRTAAVHRHDGQSQNIPGFAILRLNGYDPPNARPPADRDRDRQPVDRGPVLRAHAINLAAITAALCAGPDAGPDPSRRWIAGTHERHRSTSSCRPVRRASRPSFMAASPPVLIEAVAGLGHARCTRRRTPHRDRRRLECARGGAGDVPGRPPPVPRSSASAARFWGLLAGSGP